MPWVSLKGQHSVVPSGAVSVAPSVRLRPTSIVSQQLTGRRRRILTAERSRYFRFRGDCALSSRNIARLWAVHPQETFACFRLIDGSLDRDFEIGQRVGTTDRDTPLRATENVYDLFEHRLIFLSAGGSGDGARGSDPTLYSYAGARKE